MSGTDDGEVTPVQSGDVHRAEPFRGCDDDSVGGPEGKIRVPLHEIRGAHGIGRGDLHQLIHAVGNVAQEASLRL